MLTYEEIDRRIEVAIAELSTKEEFNNLIFKSLVDNKLSYNFLPSHYPEPEDEVYDIYTKMLRDHKYLSEHVENWTNDQIEDNEIIQEQLKLRIDTFEELALDIITDEDQYFIERPLYNNTLGKSLLHILMFRNERNHYNIPEGKWATRFTDAVKLEDIANQSIYDPLDTENVDESIKRTFEHQYDLLDALITVQTEEIPGNDFWDKVVSNPSFVQIRYMLASKKGRESTDNVLPNFLKYIWETSSPEDYQLNLRFLSMGSPSLKEIEPINAFMDDPTNEFHTYFEAYQDLNISRPDFIKGYENGHAIMMTDFKKEDNIAEIEYLWIGSGIINKGLRAKLDLKEEKLIEGPIKCADALLQFAKDYDGFIASYRNKLAELKSVPGL